MKESAPGDELDGRGSSAPTRRTGASSGDSTAVRASVARGCSERSSCCDVSCWPRWQAGAGGCAWAAGGRGAPPDGCGTPVARRTCLLNVGYGHCLMS